MVSGSTHIPSSRASQNNQVSYEESRAVRDCCNWMIHLEKFALIHQEMGPLDLDLFASCLTYQLPHFYSWRLDPLAKGTDVFTEDWSQLIPRLCESSLVLTSADFI